MRVFSLAFALLVIPIALPAQITISPAQARHHIGETATVCGTVASATYAARARGRPTFIYLDHAYPNPVFTVIIRGSDLRHFRTAPVKAYARARICVTGRITSFKGVPQMVVRDPGAIRVVEEPRR